MHKNKLRQKYKALRNELTDTEIDSFSMAIANQLLQLPLWEKSYYHVFLPIIKQKEVDTEYLLHILQGKDKNIVISKSDFSNHTLSHYLLTDTTLLKTNAWGIPEPVEGISISENKIEVVFVPLLAFDLLGNRVGYGKGFYDLFLSKCTPNTLKIGLSFFEAEDKIENISPTDIGLDFCITPTKCYDFIK